MRITVVSQYFPPEPGATQNRLGTFVDSLHARGHELTVLCEQPNHPAGVFHEGFGRRPWLSERSERRRIHRLWVYATPRKTTASRLAFYGSFAGGTLAAILVGPRPDVIFATSPPMPGAMAAAIAARMRRVPFVLDVRDLWPAAAEALGELSNQRVLRGLERAERRLYRAARRVTATTRPFCAHIDRVAGREVSVHLPNGALDLLIAMPPRTPPQRSEFVVGYAGNIGIAQGLGVALDAADLLRDAPVRFRILGDGPLSGELRSACMRRKLTNVDLLPGVPSAEVGDFLLDCDALLVPLRDHAVLDDFVPSKLYDAMAVGRPVIAALRGEGAKLVQETGCGLVVEPEHGPQLADAVRQLAGDRGRAAELGAAGSRSAGAHARSQQLDLLERVLIEAGARR
ncbi:MAG: glycosyltransferase family 4 protein [Solirubrobacteraceae bacterium]